MEQKTVVDTSLRELRRHGSDDFPIGIYRDDFSEFEHGQIAWHWHDEIQFDYIIKGTILVQVGTSEFVLKPGESIFINTGMLHRLVPVDEKRRELINNESDIHVIDSFVCSWKLAESDRLSRAYRECVAPLLLAKTDGLVLSKEESQLLRKMAEQYRKKETGYEMAVKGCLCLLWASLVEKGISAARQIQPKEERDLARIKEAMTYIQQNFSCKVSLEDVAQVVAISKSELCRCFRRVLKVSPMEYLIQFRLEEASRQLLSTDKSVTQIALETGFDSPSHLGRFFLKEFGCTPRQYRGRKR